VGKKWKILVQVLDGLYVKMKKMKIWKKPLRIKNVLLQVGSDFLGVGSLFLYRLVCEF
jgi:hypothetical protein